MQHYFKIISSLLTLVLWVPWATHAAVSPISILQGLACPCEVTELTMWLDGGTRGGTIVDSQGRELEFCLDNAMRAYIDNPEDPTVNDLKYYIGARHHSHDGAIELDVGSEEETLLVGIFESWAHSVLPAEQRSVWEAEYFSAPDVKAKNEIVAKNRISEKQELALRVRQMVVFHQDHSRILSLEEMLGK